MIRTRVWYDVAFLLMDLLARGLAVQANMIMNQYLFRTGDLAGLPLLPLFLGCRAAIRAKTSLASAAIETDGARRRTSKLFFRCPVGAELCGPCFTPDGTTLFVAVQHPGEITGASVENPASHWPDGDFAKPAVIVTWKTDGGPIGS